MSAQCNRFVQNAWKKELCSNCFKPREEHTSNEDTLRFNIEKASSNLKADSFKLQSILRVKESVQKDQRKKNVAFPEFLTEVIGYGGDDFLSDDEEDVEQVLVDSLNPEEDAIPDSEEERALSNLTRANTNFNTVTANLSEIIPTNEINKSSTTAAASTRTFASLMLGRIQKDADGRKTTLLVSVTPFGGDESLPTAKRPSDRKITVNGFSNVTKSANLNNSIHTKNEITLKTSKKITVDRKDEKREQSIDSSKLEKIMDMPLITSTNLISVIQKSESKEIDNTIVSITDKNLENATNSAEFAVKCEKKLASISRSPAIKKTDNEKPKIAIQLIQSNNNSNCSNNEFSKNIEKECPVKENGIELSLTSLKKNEECQEAAESDRPLILRGNEINKITVMGINDKKIEKTDSSEATVEKFHFKESRELAGEPDGKADEEEIIEPPALPKSPPPIETRSSIQGETDKVSLIATEPRPSFLHGSVNVDAKSKPMVPQKPSTFVGAKSVLPESESTCDISSANVKRINANYFLPPPSVQNVTNRTLPSAGTVVSQISNSTRYMTKSEVENSSLNIIGRSNVATNRVTNDKVERNDPTNHRTSVSTRESVKEEKAISTNGRDIGEGIDTDEDGSEPTRLVNNKRRMAPRPPEVTEDFLTNSSLFARNPGANLKSDSPVVREKEKRERASSCSPKFRKAVCEAPDPTGSSHSNEPSSSSPRRTISLSQDSLTNVSETREGKKRSRSRFSLKRFLRMGSRKDVDMTSGHVSNSRVDEIPSTPQPKLRLEIIHPLELDGAAVEVVGNDRISRIGEDQTDSCGSRSEATKMTRSPNGSQQYPSTVRPGKPPPPPRNQSLENWSRADQSSKPIRPPPPRVETKQQFSDRNEKSVGKMTTTTTTMTTTAPSSWQPSNTSSASSDLIYANLAAEDVTGEVRSALAPSKPQRTASMRDQTTSQPLIKKHGSSSQNLSLNDYETAATITPPTSDSLTLNDSHVYECLSSSPECDSSLELRHGTGSHHPSCKRKSDSSVMDPGVEFKFHHHHHHHHHHQPFLRSTSLPYCGSETESELYAPYTFYTGDEGAEEDQDWKSKDDELRLNQLRQRRGRSIVHRSLEDNYGAVVVANHEALAQFVEQLQVNQVAQVPASLRALKNSNPRLSDFTIDAYTSVFIGRRIFCSASWNEQNVSLCIAFDQVMHVSRKEFYLAPIIEFIETVPKEISEQISLPAGKDMEAAISVFPRLQVSTVQTFGLATKDSQDEGRTRESSFVLLQFVNALKSLQARGIEESSKSLSNVMLCREDKDVCYRLYLLQGLNVDTCDVRQEEKVSLCQCALMALQQLHLTKRLPLVQKLLLCEKAVTLSQVKSLLEFTLWGPADVTLGGLREREVTLQRWLDLERATILHALVRTRAPLTITDEYQLLFLVRTSAKMICEASILLDEQRNRLSRVC